MSDGTFPETVVTMLAKIKAQGGNGAAMDQAQWVRFWDLYAPAMRAFAARKGGEANADDIVMAVLGKLVTALREGQYDAGKGAFHSYLATCILNEVHMQRRKDVVRKKDEHVSIDSPVETEGDANSTLGDFIRDEERATPDQALEAEWRLALLRAAEEHVLTKTALSQRDRDVYRMYAKEERPIEEVAGKFGLTRNNVSQIKTRIEKRIVSVGREMLEGME